MAAPESTPIWREIFREAIWGRRGLIKSNHLWLPLAVLLTVSISGGGSLLLAFCLRVFLAVVCWSLASILLNDLTDYPEDLAAGKRRWIYRRSKGTGVLIVVLLIGIGALALLSGSTKSGALLAYGGAVALGALYSIRPLRFKERGFGGLLAYSLSATLAFVFIPWAGLGAKLTPLLILAPAVFLDKWVNLHFHQVVDYEADRRSGTRTYAVRAGRENARRGLKWAARLASLSLLAVIAYTVLMLPRWQMVVLPATAGIVLAAAVHAQVARRRPGRVSALESELSWPYLGLTYAAFRLLPLILLLRIALRDSTMWLVALAAGSLILIESVYSINYRYE